VSAIQLAVQWLSRRCQAAGANIKAHDKDGQYVADLAKKNKKVRNADIFWTLNKGHY